MTFLPIVDRELRETSRRAATYWLRFRVALLSIVVVGLAYVLGLINQTMKLGTALFWGLSGLAMIFSLLAGRRATADCISQEKREGTLGLLFLTDLKGFDVVLGKMVGNSISAFYALLTILPVMAVALLAGGVTKGELWRMSLVLVNTFLFSLAIGIFASAVSREYRTAMGMNFYVALMLIGFSTVLTFVYKGAPEHLKYPSPIYTFFLCDETAYVTQTTDFWQSLLTTHVLAWILTALACWIVPRTWGDKPPKPLVKRASFKELARALNYGSREKCVEFRKQALDINAYYWMAAKARLKPKQVWVFLGLAGLWWTDARLRGGSFVMEPGLLACAAMVLNSALRLWILTEAGQSMYEDRKGGTFELILVTRLGVHDIVRGQWMALRRQFLAPLIVVTLVELEFMRRLGGVDVFLYGISGLILLWVDSRAIGWVAMEAAMRQKTHTQAIAYTVARILVFPWALFGLTYTVLGMLWETQAIKWDPGERAGLFMWLGYGLLVDIIFGALARRRLFRDFRSLALQSSFGEPPHRPVREFFAWVRRVCVACVERMVPARRRKWIPACVVMGFLVALTATVMWLRAPSYPGPVTIVLKSNDGPLKIFQGGVTGVFFVMPDGSLWKWGKPGAPQSQRSAVPEQVGADHDWAKALAEGTHCVGLRTNGTIWSWGLSLGTYFAEPAEFSNEKGWKDVATLAHAVVAVKKNGKAWMWQEPLLGASHGTLTKQSIGDGGWAAVYAESSFWGESVEFLRKDGQLFSHLSPQFGTTPSQMGNASNWVSIQSDGLVQNSEGELWDINHVATVPAPARKAPANFVGQKTAAPYNRIAASLWLRAEIRDDGTLWQAQGGPLMVIGPTPIISRLIGNRHDWIGVWAIDNTGYALTPDGTVWTWGVQLDKDPQRSNGSLLDMIRLRFGMGRVVFRGRLAVPQGKYLDEPRPLFRMVDQNGNPLVK